MSDLNNFRKIIHQKFREDFSKNILSLRKKIFEQNAYVEQYRLYEQDDQLTATNEPLNQDEIQESFKNFFTSLSKIIKFKIKVPQTTELKNAKNITIQSINDIVKSAIDNKINANSFIDLVKKKFETTFDAIRNESQHIFDDLQKKQQEQQKNQQQNQTNQQQNQTNQQQNQTNQQQNTTVESYRKLSQNKKVLQERDDPITVNSLKNILKLTPQDKIADIISKFSKEEFEQFIDGLQKASLDTIAKALEKNTGNQESDQNKQQNQEESDQGEQTENQGQTQETPTTQEGGEGNLKLAEL